MFECNNVLNLEKSKTSNCNRLEKTNGNVFTYVQMELCPVGSRYQKKNVKTLRNLLNLLHILSCALPMLFMRNLLNLSTPCLRHRRLRPLPCVSPLAFSSASLCLFFLPSPAFPASPIFVSWLLCRCLLYLSLVSHLPATCP